MRNLRVLLRLALSIVSGYAWQVTRSDVEPCGERLPLWELGCELSEVARAIKVRQSMY